jgi:hypothetical protein
MTGQYFPLLSCIIIRVNEISNLAQRNWANKLSHRWYQVNQINVLKDEVKWTVCSFFPWQLKPFTFELDVLTGISSHKRCLMCPLVYISKACKHLSNKTAVSKYVLNFHYGDLTLYLLLYSSAPHQRILMITGRTLMPRMRWV